MRIITLVLALLTLAANAGAQTYTLTPIPVQVSTRDAYATSINDLNEVCGYDFTTYYDFRGWFYSNQGVLKPIHGFLNYCQAYGVNEESYVTGSMMDIFIWNSKTDSMEYILRPGNWAFGMAINNQRHVAGAYYTDWIPEDLKPCYYDGTMHLLSSLGGGPLGEARGINEASHVTGFAQAANNQFHMFFYANAVMTDCGVPANASSSGGHAINEADVIAGYFVHAGQSQATLYDIPTATWTPLGFPPGGSTSSALGLNDVGQVVGSATVGGVPHAVIWDALNGMRDLNDLMPPGSGMVLNSAAAINNHGLIVGTGTVAGRSRPFLLTPVPCEGDVNDDGRTDQSDLGVLLAFFGQTVVPDTNGDLNSDGLVDQADLGILLAAFGCGT